MTTIVVIAGSGRSGTSVLAGILSRLGMQVPQPELAPNEMNPRGFGESRWVVDFHSRLLRAAGVHISDARPQAAEQARRASLTPEAHAELRTWLDEQLGSSPDLVIKDPRVSWFVDVWAEAGRTSGASQSFVTMLRHPVEVAFSKLAIDGSRDLVDFMAVWVNVMLHTERSTRGHARAFVGYQELVVGWREPVARLASSLGIDRLTSASPDAVRDVDEFVSPTLHRTRASWADVELPRWLQEIAMELWDTLDGVTAGRVSDGPEAHLTLDQLAAAYEQNYRFAESATTSSRRWSTGG